MYSVAPQWSPNRSDSSDAGISRARCDIGERVAQRSRGDDARSRRGGFGAGRFGEEEGDDAVSGVAADNATGIDDASVRGAYQTANEREIRRGGKTTRERRRRFQVGHQDRCRATIGVLDGPHPFEMCQVHGMRPPRRAATFLPRV